MVDIVGLSSSTQQTNRITDRPAAKSSAARAKESTSSPARGDQIDISTGRKEAVTVSRLILAAQAEPDIRAEEVARAKEKLDNGEYEGREVSRQTAKKILGLS